MYSKIYISFVFVVMLFTILKLFFLGGRMGKNASVIPLVPIYKTYVFSVFIILFIALIPANYGSDKSRYLELFNNIETQIFNKDIGWTYYNKLIKFFINSASFFFFITAFVYYLGNYIFLKRLVKKEFIFYFLIASVGSLGYFAYGVNTIRSGIGLSFLLLAMVSRKKMYFILWVVFALLIHKSMLIPLVAFIGTKYYSNTKYFLMGWLAFLIVSILNLSVFTDFIKTNFAENDDRVDAYIGVESSELYSAGFRIDFLIYSILPMLVALFYIFKLKFKDVFYIRMFNMYIVVNSFWLLLIRIPFTDRFAYLSWFLIPFIVMYPLFKEESIKRRHVKIALGMGAIVLINFILNFK